MSQLALTPLWSQSLPGEPCGLSLAAEKGSLLVWDKNHWLYLLNQAGQIQSQLHFPQPLVHASLSDVAGAVLAIGANGLIRLLGADLTTRWERTLDGPLLTGAVESFAQMATVVDQAGGVHFFDGDGRPKGTWRAPRPLRHLAFVPILPRVVGCADFGLVGAFDQTGHWFWRETPVVHAGDLAVSGSGEVLLACFSEGLHRYDAAGHGPMRLPTPEPVRLVTQSYDGTRIAAAGLTNQLFVLDGGGQLLGRHVFEQPPVSIALGALGHELFVARQGGGGVGKWRIPA